MRRGEARGGEKKEGKGGRGGGEMKKDMIETSQNR